METILSFLSKGCEIVRFEFPGCEIIMCGFPFLNSPLTSLNNYAVLGNAWPRAEPHQPSSSTLPAGQVHFQVLANENSNLFNCILPK